MKVRILLYFLTHFVCINSFAQTKGSLKLGANISDVDLKYDTEKLFLMIVSHAQMTKGYYGIYHNVKYFVGLDDFQRITFYLHF